MGQDLPTPDATQRSEEPRRVPADLVYDTKAQPLPSGVRAVMQQRARRMLFTAEDTELVLQVSSDAMPEQLKVVGQVLDEGIPVEGAAVRLDGPRRIDESTDEEGEFRVHELPKGSYDLAIGTPDRVVGVSALDLN